MDEALRGVVEAVDALAGLPVLPTGDAELIRRLDLVHRAARRLAAVELALVREIDRAGVAGRVGATSTALWLTQRLLLTPGAARRLVLTAAAVDAAPPVLRDGLAAGLLGVDQVRAIAEALGQLPVDVGPEVTVKAAEALVDHARELPAHQLGRLGQRILWHVAPDIAEEADRRSLRRAESQVARDRYLSLTPDGPASVRLSGRLDAESAAVIRAALDPLCSPRIRPDLDGFGPHIGAALDGGDATAAAVYPRRGSRVGPSRDGDSAALVRPRDPRSAPSPTGGTGRGAVVSGRGWRVGAEPRGDGGGRVADDRTAGQRRADALVEVCRLALATTRLPGNGGDRPQVVVTVPFDPLTHRLGSGTLDSGDRVAPETARRIACDARILPAVLGGVGQPLDLGRERRLITGALRRALVLRDGGCAFPGCDRPPRWCDGHHVRHWADGGPTSLANAVLLCGYHHRLIHDDAAGWRVEVAADGQPEFVPPAWLDPARIPRRNSFHRRS